MNSGWKKDYLRYKDFFLNVLSLYNTKPNLKIYLELILSIVAIIVFSIFAVKPTILTIIDLNKEINAKEETSLKLKQKIKNLQSASTLMQQQALNIQYIDQAVPKNSMPEQLISHMELLAGDSSLQILGMSISDVTIIGSESATKKSKEFENLANDSNELAFSFSAKGSYQNIYDFLNKIENLRRPIKIDTFVINSNTTEAGKVLILTITGRVPFLSKS